MATLRKLFRKQTQDMTLGELRQALLRTSEELNDYMDLYNKEYERSKSLRNRVDKLKHAQSMAHLEFRGFIN